MSKESELTRSPTIASYDKVAAILKQAKMPVSAYYIQLNSSVDSRSVSVILNRLMKERKTRTITTTSGIFYEWVINNDSKGREVVGH